MWKYILVPFVTFLATTVNSHILLDPYVCGQPECTPTPKFQYNTSSRYEYEYEVKVNTVFAGASENRSTLQIKSMVNLEFTSECQGVLKLFNVTAADQDENYIREREESFAKELSAHSLRFAFHHGLITEICPHENEEDWALNFKRGLLSLFQNSMTRFDMDFIGNEQDIHGTCLTNYHMNGQKNTSLIITKTKDLTQCNDRFKYLSILQTVRYNFQSKFQTWPVLKSNSNCRIVIDHNIYTSVICDEKHLFDPFSGKNAGAMTTVTQNVTLVTESNKSTDDMIEQKDDELEKIHSRLKLLHNHVSSHRAAIRDLKSARDILKEICKVEESRISEADKNEKNSNEEQIAGGVTVGLWGNFVRSCRGLQHSTLMQLFTRANTICPQGRRYILDALPYIASVGSVQLIKNLTIENSIDVNTRNEWLTSMAMIPRPRHEMIESIGDLLKWSPSDNIISLTASSMVHSYCKHNKIPLDKCCEEKQNKVIMDIFEDNIYKIIKINQENVTYSRKDREKVIISIKALGNMGGFSNEFRDFLIKIIEDENLPLSIRLHTLDAFRRTPCIETRDYFLELFRKSLLNVEIRISSYLQVMRCPQYTTIHEILHILKKEKVNQVASFVWSHLENLEKSSIPSRVEKQGLLSSSNIPKPNMRPDVRKFSRNYEYGLFFDEYNAGGNYEANVIMSPDSYIPRSVSLNLTLDMFGESINIFELKLRGEGFEKYIENLFSPSGPLNKSNINDKLKSLRFKRSNNNVDDVMDKIDDLNMKNDAINHRFPLLDMGMKMFGNEISYWNAEGDSEIESAMEQLNPIHQLKNIFSGKNISYRKASMFLDTTYSVPTGCGLPMTMNMMGTSMVNFKMSGSVSNNQQKNRFTLDFEGKLNPSMSVNIAATMQVIGGGLINTGIRVNTRVQTTTALAAVFHLESGKLASLRLSLPHSKQEIFEAKSDLIVLHGNREMKQVGGNKNYIEASTCTWTAIDKAIGIKLCATYEFPNTTRENEKLPYFIFAGPAWYLLSLEKADPTAKVYSFLSTWVSNKTMQAFAFSFDTPGSKEKRMFNTSIVYSENAGKALMSFQSSDNFISAHATYKNFPDHKYLECLLDIDGKKHFDAVMSLVKQEQKNGYILIPKLHVAVNNEKISELAGTLRLAQKKGVSQCDVQLEFQTKKLASRLIGYITWNGPSKGAKLRLDYQFLDQSRETIRFDVFASNRDMGPRKDFYGELGLDFTAYPKLSFYTNFKYMGNQNHIEINYNFTTYQHLIDKNTTLQYIFSKHRTINGYVLHHQLKIYKPYLNIDYNYEENGANTMFSTTVEYDRFKHLGGLAGIWGKLYVPPDPNLYLEASLNATLPSFTPMVIKVHLFEKMKNEYDISAQCVWFTGIDVSLAALYQDMSSSHLASRRIKAVLNSSKFKEIAIDAKYTQDNKQLNVNLMAEQNKDKYGLIVRYIIFSEYNFTCYGQLEMKSKSYSVNMIANMFDDISIISDIHFDQIRDVHISYLKVNKPNVKQLNADINWDVNRDPNQKLSIGVKLLNKGPMNYGGSFALIYPGRLIDGEFDVLIKDLLYTWFIKFGWSPDDKVLWHIKAYSNIKNETIYGFLSELETPFDGWKNTKINLIWRFVDNLQSAIGNVTWEKQRVNFNLFSDYMFKTDEVYGKFSAIINSTIVVLPNLVAIAQHHHIWKKTSDTLLKFEHIKNGSLSTMMLNSSWKIEKSQSVKNISGRIELKSPVQGYKSGLLATKFMINDKKDIDCLTHMSLEEKAYAITIKGHAHRLTNSMLQFNVTSVRPFHTIMEGKFGFKDFDRHLVAMIKTPNITTGVEFLLKFISSQDFHIFSHVAIPVDFLHDLIIKAKRNSEETDFLLGFKGVKLGFTGIWHYYNIYDFQYVYKLYTPLKGFEENGLVFKNIYRDGCDSEASIRLSEHKFGVSILILENGKGVLKIMEDVYHGTAKMNMERVFEDFSTNLDMSIDTIYYQTIKLKAELNKVDGADEEEILTFDSGLIFENKTAFTLSNKLIIYDLSNMVDNVYATTPFKNFEEIKCFFTIEFILGEKYNITSLLQTRSDITWKDHNLQFYYELESDDSESKYIGMLLLESEFLILKSFNIKFEIYTEESVMKVMGNLVMPSCDINVIGHLEMEDTYLDVDGTLNMISPYLNPYNISVQFKKDFTDIENTVKCGFQIRNGNKNNYVITELSWHPNSTNYLKMKSRCSLIPIIPPSDWILSYNNNPLLKQKILKVDARVGSNDMIYSVLAEQQNNKASISFTSPHRGFRKVNFTGEIHNNEIISGVYRSDSVTYNINGKITGKNPYEVTALLKPTGDTETYTVSINLSLNEDKGYTIMATLIGRIQFTLQAKLINQKNLKDLSLIIDSTNQHFEEIFFKSKLELTDENRVLFNLQAATPLQNLKKVDTNANILLTSKSGTLIYMYNTTYLIGDGNINWSLFSDDLFIKVLSHLYENGENQLTDMNVYYSTKIPIDVGFYINFNDKWRIGGNASVSDMDSNRTIGQVYMLFPKPNEDVHTFNIKVDTSDSAQKSIEIGYVTDVTQRISKIIGMMSSPPNNAYLNFTLQNGTTQNLSEIHNALHLETLGEHKTQINYMLNTPIYKNEETIKLKVIHDFIENDVTILSATVCAPSSKQLTDVDLTYSGWKYSIGKFNTSTPFENLPWLAANGRISNNDIVSENLAEIFWPNHTAIFNSTQNHFTKDDVNIRMGVIKAEIPLSTRHIIIGNYKYQGTESWSNGNTVMYYNEKKFVEGAFKSNSSKENNNLKDTVNIDIDNEFIPLGIHYIHQYDNFANTDIKQASIYELKNSSNFNLTGILDIEPWKEGKQIKLTAIHGDRILQFQNQYESLKKELYQGSRLEWNPDVWLQYSINIENKTEHDEDSQQIKLNIEYPKRVFGFLAEYSSKELLLNGKAIMDWSISGDNKTVILKGEWKNPNSSDFSEHDIIISLSHPSFRKDVTLNATYLTDSITMSNITGTLEYSDFENERLSFSSMLIDNSDGPLRDYRFTLNCDHPATNMDVILKGDLNLKQNIYYFNNFYKHKKSLFNETIRQSRISFNPNDHFIIFERTKDSDWYLVNGTWLYLYPDYKVSFTVNKTSGNDVGAWILSIKDKSIIGHYNSSDDLSYHLIGKVNDARSAELNAWRDFEEVKTMDISSYIRLNHSKLLTSKVTWRPEMYQQMKNLASFVFKELFTQINEIIVILKNVPMESHESLKNVWNDARPRVKDLLNDLNDLHIIVEDMENFQNFLNDSYNANEFYIKNIVEYSLNVIDELSLRNHIESLPAIVNEMWQMMGKTRTSLKESITWIVETIKSSYTHFVEQVGKILEGNLMDRVSELIESGIVKYDSFIKYLHLEFISFCESLWTNASSGIYILWKKIVKTIEPTFIHILHHLESYIYQFGSEALDFFYARSEELQETPFFGMISQFTQSIDRLWKDIHNEDAITNIQKYSSMIVNFVKTKILVHIPFLKEINEITSEIINEINELQQMGAIKIIKIKFWEAIQKLEWWYHYFKIETAIKTVSTTIYKKLVEIPKTAIQIEESHRTPKTNFIFEPRQGLLLLEQKLPISWHAFNRTPDFSETPEYKAVHDLVNSWFFSNTSLISYYYEFKLYTDIYNILPPFAGHAIMTGYGSIVTFDNQMFSIKETGMYLLATDVFKRNFTILISCERLNQFDLLLISKKDIIKINLFDQSVRIGNSDIQTLPLKHESWILQRDDEEIKIENSEGVTIKCNYLFKTCIFDFEGTYFSRLGGLFGTMNNEGFDDIMTPKREFTENKDYVKSWKLFDSPVTKIDTHEVNNTVCEIYFKNNVSPLKACFSLIDSNQFYEECMDGKDPCILANAYSQLCFYNQIPIRVPVKCMECVSPSNTIIEEGMFIDINDFSKSTDIVFIVEAHKCNYNMRSEKNIDFLVSSLESKLNENGFTNNRYTIVAYGGQGIYKSANSLYVNNQSFLNADEIVSSFDHLVIDQNNNLTYGADTFDALNKASNLNFRPGVSKTFILFPCSKCNNTHFKLDYAVIHQVLMDSSVTLHIVMNDEFMMNKKRILKTLYGVDRKLAYTSKDLRKLNGDAKIRPLIKIPKSTVGFCASLAMETNGTLFSVSKLRPSEPGRGQRAASVLAARAALPSSPCARARCECHAARLRCTVCPRYIPSNVIDDISLSVWESSEIEDFIDNFLELPMPSL